MPSLLSGRDAFGGSSGELDGVRRRPKHLPPAASLGNGWFANQTVVLSAFSKGWSEAAPSVSLTVNRHSGLRCVAAQTTMSLGKPASPREMFPSQAMSQIDNSGTRPRDTAQGGRMSLVENNDTFTLAWVPGDEFRIGWLLV